MCVDTGGGDLIYPRYTRFLLGDHYVNRFVDISFQEFEMCDHRGPRPWDYLYSSIQKR